MNKIKLAIVDDSEKLRKAIIRLLNLENDFEVILEAENGHDLLEQLASKTPDVILLDIRMPVMDGIEATDKIKEYFPHLKIIAYSQYDKEENIIKMNIQGVKSFIGKEGEPQELFKAIRIVHDGGAYLTEKAAIIIQKHLSNFYEKIDQRADEFLFQDGDIKFLKMILEGLTSKEIGEKINRSHRTVEDMRDKLYRKYNVANKQQLVMLLAKWI
jgi:DNA-binding NarL/FixJ family response regulator